MTPHLNVVRLTPGIKLAGPGELEGVCSLWVSLNTRGTAFEQDAEEVKLAATRGAGVGHACLL